MLAWLSPIYASTAGIYSCEIKVVFACAHARRPTSLSSVVGVVRLVVHDQPVVHEVEAVRPSLVRALHHLTHWNAKASHSQRALVTTGTSVHSFTGCFVKVRTQGGNRDSVHDKTKLQNTFAQCNKKKQKNNTVLASTNWAQVRIKLMSFTVTYFRIKFPQRFPPPRATPPPSPSGCHAT